MKRHRFLVTTILGIAASPGALLGQPIWQDRFDAYPVGSINGLGGWQGWDNNAAAAGEVSGEFARSGTKSQKIATGDDSVRRYMLPPGGSGIYQYTAWHYVPSSSTGVHYFALLNRYLPGGPYNWSIRIRFDLDADTVTSELDNVSVPLVRDRWVELRIVMNFNRNPPAPTRPCGAPDCGRSQVFYDGQLVGYLEPWIGRVTAAGGALNLAAVSLSTQTAPGTVYYDDMRLRDVDSPSEPACDCPGDVNGDGVLDGRDMGGFVACLLGAASPGNCRCAEMDGSGAVDPDDLPAFILALLLTAPDCPGRIEESDIYGFDPGDKIVLCDLQIGEKGVDVQAGEGSVGTADLTAFLDICWTSPGTIDFGGALPPYVVTAPGPFPIQNFVTFTRWSVTGSINVINDPNPQFEPDFDFVVDMQGGPLETLCDPSSIFEMVAGGTAVVTIRDPAFGQLKLELPITSHRMKISKHCIYRVEEYRPLDTSPPPTCPPTGWPVPGEMLCLRCDARQKPACPGNGWYWIVNKGCFARLTLLQPSCTGCPENTFVRARYFEPVDKSF